MVIVPGKGGGGLEQNAYELLALAARYLFAGLMILIVARAWRNTVIDSRRAQTLRRLSPQTGLSGEVLVLEGDELARRGMRYPLILEGMLGSARKADLRIRHSSVRRRHADFELTTEGLSLRACGGALLRDHRGRRARRLLLRDGEVFYVGRVKLMLVLSDSIRAAGDPEAAFDPDRLFDENPVLARSNPQPYSDSY